MAPIIEVSDEVMKTLNPNAYTQRTDLEDTPSEDKQDFIYVPSINLYVARQRTLQGKNWFEAHRELQSQGKRMITLPEFVEVLKYTRENLQEVYDDITEVRSPWRAEWIDADFKVKDGKLYVNSNHVLDSNGNLIPQNSEVLSRTTLMEDKRISLEDWLQNPTKQGFPTKKTSSGDLFYYNPRDDDNSVAEFYARGGWPYFDCDRSPSGRYSSLGVRAVRNK